MERTSIDQLTEAGQAAGVAAVRPLVRAFGSLIGSDGIEVAARRAEDE